MSAAEDLHPFAFQFCSGLGQYDVHTRTLSTGKPNFNPHVGKPYVGITEEEVAAMVASPPQMEKFDGRWMIPSIYVALDARTHDIQRARGKFGWLTLDVDKGNHELAEVDAAVVRVLGDVRRLVYSTKSSKPENRKWRVLVPLAGLIAGGDYADTASAFYDLLGEKSDGKIQADRALCRPGQLVYLPNRGVLYEHQISDRPHLDLTNAHAVIKRRELTRRALATAEAEAKALRAAKATKRPVSETSVIDAFKSAHTVAYMLSQYGYENSGNDWRSSYQGSGSFATRDCGEYWVSLSGSDAAEGLGLPTKSGHRTGDAFSLFVHYEHGGNVIAAVRAYAEVLAGTGWRHPSPDQEFSPVNDNDASADADTSGLNIICAASFAGLPVPERQSLDKQGLFPIGAVSGMGGDGGTGKSLLALQLSCGVAFSGSWLGMEVRRGPVLYYSAEDDRDELHIRSVDIAKAEGFPLEGLADLHIAVMAGEDAVLATEDTKKGRLEATPLYRKIREALARLRPVLLVLDNLADVFSGNENNRSLARQFIGMLRSLAIEFGCAVLLLYHPSLSGLNSGTGNSGSTAWNGSFRSRLYLRRELDAKGEERNKRRRVLEHKKANYSGGDTVLTLEWEGGRYGTLDGLNELDGTLDVEARSRRAERVFLDLVRWHRKHGVNVSNMLGTNHAPKVFAEHELCEGISKHELKRAMDTLFGRGAIETHESGPPSRRVRTIVEALEGML